MAFEKQAGEQFVTYGYGIEPEIIFLRPKRNSGGCDSESQKLDFECSKACNSIDIELDTGYSIRLFFDEENK